jgi:branched-chain amino acid transport system substrate-binding protein
MAVLTAAALAGSVASCSLLVEGGRCSTDGDCASVAVGATGAVCHAGACVRSALASSGADGGNDGQDPVADRAPDAGTKPECATNAECIERLGEYTICEKTRLTCVRLLSPDCTAVHGDYENDRAIFVGTLFKQGATAGDVGASPDALSAIHLAFDELRNTHGGLPDPAGATSRPLVTVECNQTQDPVRATTHLADDVHVPAIIGAATSYVTIQAATQVAIDRGVYMISPYASSPGLTTLDDRGLVWRTYPSDALQAVAVPRLVEDLTASPRFTEPRAPRTTVRIGIVYKDDTYGQGLRDIILQRLRFNGGDAAANVASGTLKLYSYPNTEDPENADYDFTEVTTKVISEQNPADILMILGTSEAVNVFSYAESHWPGAVLPHYIMPDGMASAPKLSMAIDDVVNGGTTDSKNLRSRIRGTIVNVFSGPVFDAFSLRFSGDPVNGSNAYDAAYVVAYGLFGIGAQPLTGANLAAAMTKLHAPGIDVGVGSGESAKAFHALADGNVVVTGAAGKLSFDLATGDVSASGAAVWCLGLDGKGKAHLVTRTGQTYSAADDALIGKFPEGGAVDPCGFN